MIFDQHLHSSFSGDSDVSPIDMINRGKELKLPGITFTDHLDWDYFSEPGLFDLDYASYVTTITALKKEHESPDFKINLGLELGLQEHLKLRHKHLIQMLDLDLLIGSVHVVEFKDPYYDSFYKERDADKSYKDYFDAVFKNIKCFTDFDTLGHLDYIKRYVIKHFGEEDGKFDERLYGDVIDEILNFLIKNDKALEINTGAFHYGFDEPNPSYNIIKRYKELSGQLITIGADAHEEKYVGDHFDEVTERLKEIGFSSYYVYKKRKPVEKSL